MNFFECVANSKPFQVVAHSNDLDSYFFVKSYAEALPIFERLIDSDVYDSVYIASSLTGELYAHFNKTSDESGTEISFWYSSLLSAN